MKIGISCLVFFACLSLTYGFCPVHSGSESEQPPQASKHYDEDGEHNDDYDHEAVLGSHDAIEEFSKLSPEEARSRLGKLIDHMDTDKDGTINTEELSEWIKKSFMKLNEEETKDRMTEDDSDEDGQITWAEYLNSVYGMTEEEVQKYRDSDLESEEAKKQFDTSFKHAKERFAAADLNGDKQLDLSEYAAFNNPNDYPHMTKVEGNRILVDFDSDGDGKITEEEYLNQAMFSKKTAEDKIAEAANFRYQDKDGDGSLNMEEILEWVSPNLDQIVSEETSHLLSETDKDKDGRLTKEEIFDEIEMWVGSEATEYGEMLINKDEL